MELEKLLSEQTGIPARELEKVIEISSDGKNIYIRLKGQVSRSAFRKIANVAKKLGGEYSPEERRFRLPERRAARWDEVTAALGALPESVKPGLCFEVVIKPIGFLEPKKFKLLAMAISRVGGNYISEQGCFKIPVELPEVDIKRELIAKIQDMNTPAFQRAVLMERLIDEQNLSQEELAEELKRSRSWVANHLRLLQLRGKLPDALLNRLTEGAARELLSAPPEKLKRISAECAELLKREGGLSKQAVRSLLKK